MIRSWIAAHRSLSITAVSGALITALIATVALVSGGYTAQRMDLGDAAVWVTSASKQLIGRANTEIHQLNTVVTGGSGSLDVVQSGGTVLMVDSGSNAVGVVDPATSAVGKNVPLPAKDPTVALAGGRVAIGSAATGQLWLSDVGDLRDFSPQSQPTLELGGRIVSAVDPDGRVFAYSPGAGKVFRIDAATDDTVAQTDSVQLSGQRHGATVTAVGGEWAILQPDASALVLRRGRIALPSWLGPDAVLEQAAGAGDTVYVASPTGLVSVDLNGGAARSLLRGSFGSPAAPAVSGDCSYAAWAGGTTWTRCGSDAPVTATLTSRPSNPSLTFRSNGDDIVLNDTSSGRSWAVQHGNALIDNWADFAQKDTTRQQTEENTEDTPPTYEKDQQPPVAVDDVFGARPGRASPLPVLLNDYDPNGDVLVIDSIDAPPLEDGTVDLIENDQQLQVKVPAAATGSFSLRYTITDGRGGTASATVTVQIRTPGENSAPIQAHTTKATVQSGGRTTTQVLGDWYDPDGDPFYLSGASVDAPDTVTFTPEGGVVYSDAGAGGTLSEVALLVSDGTAEGGGTLAITVRGQGDVPIITEPFPVIATAGEPTTVSPLAHVRGGSGPLRLSAVPAKPDATISPDLDAGTFRFTSTTVGTHLVDYAVTDGISTVNGQVRVEVKPPPSGRTQPITVPHTVFIQEQSSHDVDVLATDIDPAGGVLIITGLSAVPAEQGVRVEVLRQELLRVTLTRPLAASVTFGYRVSNGLAEADGSVTVVQIPRPAVRQPPVANPDTVSVRVGDAIDIPVLANDSQPDGDPLTLDPTLSSALPSGAGLLFASGSVLRYLAPRKPGNYTAAYRVDAPDGQWASGQVTIAVRELDAATNNPPVPKTVTARVLAGGSVRIPIPLSGIDPDGDSVKLVGQDSNPNKGAVTATGTDWIQYQAGDYSSGLDTFTYSVVDALGARASGTVRMGIAAAASGARNPVAVEDQATVRPGRTVSIQVLANDSDPDNGPLTITTVRQTTSSRAKATISGQVIRVTAPAAEGRYGFIYEIQNQTGGTSSNFLTVVVKKDAPLARPQVRDTVLGLSDIIGRQSVNVDVLANVFFPDGPVSTLSLKLLPGYGNSARVTAGKHVRVQVLAASQIIPFSLSHPDDASVVSYGFIWVPGTDDALPQLKRGAPKLTVQSESTLTIHLSDYVVAVGGKDVRLTDASTVHATHANGGDLVVNGETLSFTSAARYFGPASISFEVTDGASASDPAGRVATLVLPITVTPRQNQPPVFSGGQIETEPGQQKTIDLVKLTRYPYAKDQSELAFRVLEPRPAGVSVTLTGTQLTIRTDEKTPTGSTASVLIGVRDSLNDGTAGRIDLSVVPSTRPLAVPAADSVIAERGRTTTLDVLANDAATNPFPGTPLTVVAVRGIDSGSLPPGVAVAPSADRSRLAITVSPDAAAADANLQYEVADATGDPTRYAWGTVRISVQDRPDPVADLQATGFGDRSITMSWAPGAANNSPISGYDVTLTRADNGQTVGVTTCATTTCVVATPGNGHENAVNVAVVAKNAIGSSDRVTFGDAVWSNVVPPAPQNVVVSPRDHGARVSWSAPAGGSGAGAVTRYRVTMGSASVTVGARTMATDIADPSIANGSPLTVTVSSLNDYYGSREPTWNSASATVTPAGPPLFTGAPVASSRTDGSGVVSLDWAGALSDNGAPTTVLTAVAFQGTSPSCDADDGSIAGGDHVRTLAPGTTSTDFGLTSGQAYSFVVFAFNGQGCTASPVASAVALAIPGQPLDITVSPPSPSNPVDSSGTGYLAHLTGIGIPANTAGALTVGFEYRFVGAFTTDAAPIGRGDAFDAGPQGVGIAATVQLRTVADFGGGVVLRSAWSSDIGVGAAVDLSAATVFQPDASGGGTFSWTSAPHGAGYTAVEYQCSGQSGFSQMAATGTCSATRGLLTSPSLTVRVTANGATYEKIYRP